jgi:hypothetical protein
MLLTFALPFSLSLLLVKVKCERDYGGNESRETKYYNTETVNLYDLEF